MALCISHDWNIYPLKEFKLGIKHEKAGTIGYLEGVAFFFNENEIVIQDIDGSPVVLGLK